jgi:TetR/AcrR family transcriptional repressor of multidrug resistance operon
MDRARAVRVALRRLVARNGLHGASMGAVAKVAGVAAGTAYVHYASKDELVVAAFLEAKRELGLAATSRADPTAPPHERFIAIWLALHAHLTASPEDARFLVQVEHSPYLAMAHEAALAVADDPLVAAARAADMVPLLVQLPDVVTWELGLAPAVRLAAADVALTRRQLAMTAEACWRAITTGTPERQQRQDNARAERPGPPRSRRPRSLLAS